MDSRWILTGQVVDVAAAKAASKYGLAVKVSADGDISVCVRQKEFFGI